MPYNPFMESPRRRRGRSSTPHGRKKRHSSVETIRASVEVQENGLHIRQYGYRSGTEPITTFTHEAGPGSPFVPDSRDNEDSRRTQELLTRIADGIREKTILRGENEQLEGEKERLEEQNEQLMEANASLSKAFRSLERDFDEMRSKTQSLENQVNEMRRETSGTGRNSASFFGGLLRGTRNSQMSRETEVSSLREETNQYKKRTKELATENRKMARTISEQENHIQKQRTEFAQELDDLTGKAFVKGARLSDTEIQAKWKTLGFSIRQFVSEYFPEPLDGQTAQLLAQQQEFTWLPELTMALQAPMLYQVTLESWIWHFLCFRIFDSHSLFWAGEVGKTFRIQCDQFRDAITEIHSRTSRDAAAEKFHDWRVRSADLISMVANIDEARSAVSLVQQMLCLLDLAISSAHFMHGHVVPEAIQDDLLSIVKNAAHLAGIFRASKADFQVFITRIKLPLTCHRVKRTNGFVPVVDLAISPGILKTGNADGTNYGSSRVLVKLQTICNLRPLLEFLHGDGMEQQLHESEQGMPVWGEDRCAINEEQAGMERQMDESEEGPLAWGEHRCAIKEEQAPETCAALIVVKEELEG